MTTTPDPWHSPDRPRVINLIDELPDNLGDYAAKAQVVGYIERLAAHGIFAPRGHSQPSVTLTVGVLKALMRAAYLDGRADEEADAKLRPPPEPRRAPFSNEITFCEAFNILLEGVGEEGSALGPEDEGLIFEPHIRAFADRQIALRDAAERVARALRPDFDANLGEEDDPIIALIGALVGIADEDRISPAASTPPTSPTSSP